MVCNIGAAQGDGGLFHGHDARAAPKKSIARKSERRPEPAVCKYGGLDFSGVPDSANLPTNPYKIAGDF